jgi:putative NIF3 family GTP cyclohydrolase 1 type 2
MQAFLASEAQVYISGDIHYHDAREAEDVDRGIIDIGHFPSEHLMVDALAQKLKNVISKSKMDVEIMACTIEKDPFRMM